MSILLLFLLLTVCTITPASSKAFLEHLTPNSNLKESFPSDNMSLYIPKFPYFNNVKDNFETNLTNDDELNYMITLFNHSYFYGQWENANNSIIPEFLNRAGYSYLHYDAISSFSLDLHIYDGNYVDGKIMTLLYHDLRENALYDKTTQTLTLENAAITRQIAELYGNADSPLLCSINVTILFRNADTLQPFSMDDDTDKLGVQFAFQSSMCAVNLVTSLMTKTDPLLESQIWPYIAIVSLTATCQCILIHFLNQFIEKQPSLARRTSAWTIVILNAFDLYFFLTISYFFMSYSPIYEISSVPCAVLSFCYEPKLIWKILQHHRETASSRPNTEVKTYFCMLSLFLCVLASLVVFPNFSYLLGSIYLLPQIIQNAVFSSKYKWNFWVIGGLGVPKFLYMLYTKIDPQNLLRLSPDYRIPVVSGSLLLTQLIILVIQMKWPRFGFEEKPAYLVNNHYKEISASRQDICAICLDRLKDSFGSNSSPSQSFIGTHTTLQDRRKILTPCQHEFHLSCLKQWLESKLECPYCRKHLPLLPEEYSDD